MVMVTEELDINDAAMLLLKPDGVVARNEDWLFGTNNPFTNFAVDIYYVDVPITCYQGITMGSNEVDLLKKIPKDHHIETVYLKPLEEIEDSFDRWFHYRHSDMFGNEFCMEETQSMEEKAVSLGVLMIIEAEDSTLPLQSSSIVRASISNALENASLMETSVRTSFKEDGYEIVFLLKEGYAITRVWPEQEYCAFDLLLWSSTEKQEMAKAELVAAVGSTSVSWYRIVTGGMLSAGEDKSHVGPYINVSCGDRDHARDDSVEHTPTEQSTIDTVLTESASLMQNSSVLVLCGDSSSPCSSLKLLANSFDIIPVWSCPNLAGSSKEALQDMIDCERETLQTIEASNDIGGIVIDPVAPRVMGQILHKILANKRVRSHLLTENHVVLAISPSTDSAWRRALVDRFRTDFLRYGPAYRADVVFHNTSLQLQAFSSGDNYFYSNLMDVLASIEYKTGMVATVRNVMNGVSNYVPNFAPTKTASFNDYNYSAPLTQWQCQHQLGKQTLLQFKASEKLFITPLREALQDALFELKLGRDNIDDIFMEVHDSIGCVIVGSWLQGSVVLNWDGKDHVSINLFTLRSDHRRFEELITREMGHQLNLTTRDEMPRGIGRVVNFQEDLESSAKIPHWAK